MYIYVISNHKWGVSTRAVSDSLYYAFINKMDGNDITNRIKTRKFKKYSKKTSLQNDLNYAPIKMVP